MTICITEYSSLRHYVKMFVEKKANLIILESSHGLGKSSLVNEECIDKDIHILNSHLTPLSNYINLYVAKDKPICFRDLDTLINNKANVSLLKQCCETSSLKQVSWNSTTARLKEIPLQFETTSNVLIETNSFIANNPSLQALEGRGLHILFQPSKLALIEKMKEIVAKPCMDLTLEQRQTVLDFITDNKDLIPDLNLRQLINGMGLFAYSLVQPSFDWKQALTELLELDKRLSIIKQLSETDLSVKEQIIRSGFSRSQYFRLKAKI